MTPLGQQIARLLAPERWDEWRFPEYAPAEIEHVATGIRLHWLNDLFWFDTFPSTKAFGLRERWRLMRMARRVHRHLLERKAAKLSEKLMTEEERAIEELLR